MDGSIERVVDEARTPAYRTSKIKASVCMADGGAMHA